MTRPGIRGILSSSPRKPAAWLRPTFLVSRGTYTDMAGKQVQLAPVYIAVIRADEHSATFEVLGSNCSPSTISKDTLANLLRKRGVQQ